MTDRSDKVGKKSEPAESPRKGVNTRITDDLRLRLERHAHRHNRTVGSEIEHRLETSFRFNLTGEEGLGAVLDHASACDFFSTCGSVFGSLLQIATERGLSEVETRTALRAALDVVSSRYLWVGGVFPDHADTQVPAGTKLRDLPPDQFGRRLAAEHLLWESAWSNRSVVDDAYNDMISDHWTGDGTVIVAGDVESFTPPGEKNL